jgi:transmembrane sensor
VVAGHNQIVAVGTQFDVRIIPHATLVTVLDGRVAVGRASDDAEPRLNPMARPTPGVVLVNAGQQVEVNDTSWAPVAVATDTRRATAWLHRQIVFQRTPLGVVADEFNRYSTRPIEIATPALKGLEISGVFATDDIDAFVAFLRSLDGVRVEVNAGRIRVLRD